MSSIATKEKTMDVFEKRKILNSIFKGNLKQEYYHICISIIQCKDLLWTNMNPVVCVEVGDEKKFTKQKENSDSPYFNEQFVFEFHTTKDSLMAKLISLTVLQNNSIFQSKKVLGSITMDIETVYLQPDHQIYNKWSLLLSSEDMFSEKKGYIKSTISILGKGEIGRIPTFIEDFKEGPLMDFLNEGQMARYICRIYEFDGPTAMPNFEVKKFYESQKKISKSDNNKGFKISNKLELYVEVKFGNLCGTTSRKQGEHSVEWNEQIVFLARFPPLFQRLHIFIKDTNNAVISRHFILMREISHTGKEGFAPSFGPSHIYMYTDPRMNGILNYAGKLLFSLETILSTTATFENTKENILVQTSPIPKIYKSREESPSNLILFCCITQTSLMDKKIPEKETEIELGFGPDTTTTTEAFNRNLNASVCSKPKKHKLTPQILCELINEEDKPCLWINSIWPSNYMYRIYQSNTYAILSGLLEEKLLKISNFLSKCKYFLADDSMDSTLKDLVNYCTNGLNVLEANPKEDGTRTLLDWERLRLLQKELESIVHKAQQIRQNIDQNIMYKVKDLQDILKNVNLHTEEPQDPYPDVLLSLRVNGRIIAQQKLKIREFIHSFDPNKCGKKCGKREVILFKKVDSKRNHEFPITMAADIYFWVEFLSEPNANYLKGIPRGYLTINEKSRTSKDSSQSSDLHLPPKYLHYYERHNYQLRSHFYEGRFIPGADISGLSDPYIKVVLGNYESQTQVCFQTLNPLWNQMLLFDDVILYGTPDDIKADPPTILLEAMDRDKYSKDEFIGRGLAVPRMKILNDSEDLKNNIGELQWTEVYSNYEVTGELLTAFELIEISDEDKDKTFQKDLRRKAKIPISQVPSYIRPKLTKYRMMVLFWGLRNFSGNPSSMLNYPHVTVELGGDVINSSIIKNAKDYPNFASPIMAVDMELPENENYCPSLIIKVWDRRSFGRLCHVGSHIVSNFEPFIVENFNLNWPLPIIMECSTCIDNHAPLEIEYENEILKHLEERIITIPLVEKKTRIKLTDGDQIFDWWTKYYASILEMKENFENTSLANDRDQHYETEFEKEDLFLTQGDTESNVTGQKKLDLTTSAMKSFKKLAKILIFIGVMRRDQPDIKMKESILHTITKKRLFKPATFLIYSNELEKQPEYHGFHDWMDSFEIYHGKKRQDEDMQRMIVGKFKGLIQLQKVDKNKSNNGLDVTNNDAAKSNINRDQVESKKQALSVQTTISFTNQPLRVWVRVYVIRAYSLTPKDISGGSDPYVVVFVGDNKTEDKVWKTIKKKSSQMSGKRSEYVPRNLNPLFGRCFEVEALLPRDNILTVCLMDWDMYTQDDLIGKTEIDIENRLYSKHRATCGISSSYISSGYNKWRDKQKPSVILSSLCKSFNIDAPTYRANEVTVGQKSISLHYILKKGKHRKRENLALTALKQWPEVAKANGLPAWSLVPEHVETRSLYDPKQIGIEQGKVEMWVDMFRIPDDMHDSDSIQEYLGPPVDISPRKPTPYELRVIIWNTDDVELCDTNIITGEKSSDIFVKGWLYGPKIDYQCTDVHRNSFSGEGSFNWRFIFPFLYISAERSLVIEDADKIYFGKRLIKSLKSLMNISTGIESRESIPCLLQLQVWDEDHFSPNDFIGSVSLNIDSIPIGSKDAAKCNGKILSDHPRINLFKTRQIRGWWPIGRRVHKRKNEDSFKMTGKIELEFHLLTKDEAEANPAGRGRQGPCALSSPRRPSTLLGYFKIPLKILRYVIWGKHKKYVIRWTIILLLFLFILYGFYSIPGYSVKKILKA